MLQYGVLTPQVGLVGDLKLALAEKCGIRSNRLSIATGTHENLQFIGDHNQVRTVGEDQTLIAFELPTGFQDIAGHPDVDQQIGIQKQPVQQDMQSGSFVSSASSIDKDGRDKKKLSLCPCPSRQPIHVEPRGSECHDENEAFGSENENTQTEAAKEIEANTSDNSKVRGNNIQFILDERVDARDFEGNWFPGTIVDVQFDEGDEGEMTGTGQDLQRRRLQEKLDRISEAADGHEMMTASNRNRTGRVMVNFDGFQSRFNEWFDIGDLKKIQPIYTHTVQPPQKLNAALLLHRVRKNFDTAVERRQTEAARVSTSSASINAGVVETSNINDDNRFFGTPRQIWFGSRLPSSDVHTVVAKHISHLIKGGAGDMSDPPYKLLILKRRNDGTYGKPRPC